MTDYNVSVCCSGHVFYEPDDDEFKHPVCSICFEPCEVKPDNKNDYMQ